MKATHKELKNIKSLRTRKGRRLHRLFIAEGVRLLEEAIRYKLFPDMVYYSQSLISARAEKLIERLQRRKVLVKTVSASEFATMADTREPQGILAVLPIPEMRLEKLYRPGYRRLLLCEDISDPGNLGTLVRSAAAFGIDLVLLVGSCADPFSPKVVRSTAGAIFAIEIAQVTPVELFRWSEREAIKVIASNTKGEIECGLLKKKLRGSKSVLAIGSEATGLSEAVSSRADFVVRINHSDRVESLNAAVAGSILMNQIYGDDRK